MHSKEKHYHKILAEYFEDQSLFLNDDLAKPNARKCTELVYQQIKSEMWDELEETLTDILFLDAKCKCGLVNEMLDDYNTALEVLPESNKECTQVFEQIFKHELHNIRHLPNITFQQMYNHLQWYENKTKLMSENARQKFISKGGYFLRQSIIPEFLKINPSISLKGHSKKVNFIIGVTS